MTKKNHTQNGVTFGYDPSLRKWTFTIKKFTYLTAIKGGNPMSKVETATKIANLVKAGFVRTRGEGLDGLSRANIEKLLHPVE